MRKRKLKKENSLGETRKKLKKSETVTESADKSWFGSLIHPGRNKTYTINIASGKE